MATKSGVANNADPPPDIVGKQIRARRKALRLAQREVAEQAEVAESSIKRIESGNFKKPHRLKQILSALDYFEARAASSLPAPDSTQPSTTVGPMRLGAALQEMTAVLQELEPHERQAAARVFISLAGGQIEDDSADAVRSLERAAHATIKAYSKRIPPP